MIITNIHAGMGNQMFMYAAGLSVATRLNTELKLGLWGFRTEPNKERPYALGCFPEITEREASFRDLWKIYPGLALMSALSYKPIKKYSLFRRALRKIMLMTKIYDGLNIHSRITYGDAFSVQKYSRFYIQHKAIHHKAGYKTSYYPEFNDIPDGVCLMGYWVSEKFFSGISDLVRRKFTFPAEYFRHDAVRRIKTCNSVALHVRRGDKAGVESGFFCSEAPWLKMAIKKMASLTENPSFFVFSDDISWCRENLPKIYDSEYTYLEGNTPAQDMALMTKCRHVIMAPSTFSWWGAWLNDNPGKIIIAGLKRGLKGVEVSSDSIPDKWIVIE